MVAVAVMVPAIVVPIALARIEPADDKYRPASVRDAAPVGRAMKAAAAALASLGRRDGGERDDGRKSDACKNLMGSPLVSGSATPAFESPFR